MSNTGNSNIRNSSTEYGNTEYGNSDNEPKILRWSIEHLLKTMQAPSPDVLSTVFSRWPEVVGQDLAAHSKPSFIEGDTLVVNSTDSTWASQLIWLETELLGRIQEISGSNLVQSIKVRVKRQG